MSDPTKELPDNTATLALIAGVGAVVLGYFMPAVVFKGSGNAVHDLSILEKLPVMSGLCFLALAAAVATRFSPALQRWAQHATVAAIVLALTPALWGFTNAIDAWSSIRATILQIAGTRTVFINPGPAYLPLLAGAALLAYSLRAESRPAETTAAA
jgi:hypothetical protein